MLIGELPPRNRAASVHRDAVEAAVELVPEEFFRNAAEQGEADHRRRREDGDEPSGPVHFHFGRREAIFLLVSIFLILLFIPGAALSLAAAELQESPSGALLALVGLLLVALAIYFFVRLTLLLPAVAIGDPLDPRLVLERTRGNFWRLFAVMFAVGAPILILSSLAGTLMAGGGAMQVLAVAIAAFVYVFFAVVNVAVLSIAYRELIGPPGSVPRDSEPHIDPAF